MAKKSRSITSNASTTSPNSVTKPLPSQPTVMQPKSIARPPKKIGLLKRWWLFYEGSFAGSMLETWEKILLHTFMFALLLLFYVAVSTYLPARISLASKRIQWYIYGGEETGKVAV
ncbi:hypothetical protein BCR35DRAFT_330164 [Leucosporidium creatinivorum]|uniref:Uncharacterized protein n=1 Tax=Leucosporidium creatinivorum TaxID=106004 RepID=A0A1Y2FXN1_9BASI|nr:hypothetical protein BCR35DRAFT_330164 [Leucosporidium creatinivorum]